MTIPRYVVGDRRRGDPDIAPAEPHAAGTLALASACRRPAAGGDRTLVCMAASRRCPSPRQRPRRRRRGVGHRRDRRLVASQRPGAADRRARSARPGRCHRSTRVPRARDHGQGHGNVARTCRRSRVGLATLLPEQRALLGRLANGETIATAAAAEYLSLRTANRRIAQARTSLGVRTTREAVLVFLHQRRPD